MALKDYKNINDTGTLDGTRGQRVESDDLKIFKRQDSYVVFGMDPKDIIEIAVYDLNNNLVDWGIKMPYTATVFDDGDKQQLGAPSEIVLQPKEDLEELGYTAGSYKVSYQFFRNRFGSHLENKKAYIQEISPSRTEVRILPLLIGNEAIDKNTTIEFENFKLNTLSPAQVINILLNALNGFDVNKIDEQFNQNFIEQFKKEFSITNVDKLNSDVINDLRDKLVELFKTEPLLTKNKINNLFVTTLSEVLNEFIPNVKSEKDNEAENIISEELVTVDNLPNTVNNPVLVDFNTYTNPVKRVVSLELQKIDMVKETTDTSTNVVEVKRTPVNSTEDDIRRIDENLERLEE